MSTVEVVDPIALSARMVGKRHQHDWGCDIASVPDSVLSVFDSDLCLDAGEKRALVSLGMFTIVKIERNVQLLIPCYDFCIPSKECVTATEENPCDLFSRLNFPIDEFFPPLADEFPPLGNTHHNSCDERLEELIEEHRDERGHGRHHGRRFDD